MLGNLFCLKESIDNPGHRVEVFIDSKEKFLNCGHWLFGKCIFNGPDVFSPFSHTVVSLFFVLFCFSSHLMHLLESLVLSQKRTGIILFLVLQVLGNGSRGSNDLCRFCFLCSLPWGRTLSFVKCCWLVKVVSSMCKAARGFFFSCFGIFLRCIPV